MPNENELTADLEKIERILLADECQPPAGLRDRVLARVEMELDRSKRRNFWAYVSTLAASVLLLLNVSFSASLAGSREIRTDRDKVAALSSQLKQLQLGLSDEEIRQQALLLSAADDLVPLGRPYGSSNKTPDLE
ncbi:MAG: hypothetical protein HZA50_17555 [Planctomycetes bacterium]|nr:hypothetical protein [Planctomycetota bacterium]